MGLNTLCTAILRSGVLVRWLLLVCLSGLPVVSGVAQDGGGDRWVSDSFEVTLRTGKSTKERIVRMLSSGTKVELLETDADAGYARVRTAGGTEGWILTRYLERQAPARVALPAVQQQLERSEAQRRELQASNRELQQERDALAGRISELERSETGLQGELDNIRKLSASAVQIDQKNRQLQERLTATEQALAELQAENEQLSGRAAREWFIVGAGVVVLGMLLGLILPRIRWRRKSSWSDF